MQDWDLILIADSFPRIEELKLRTDADFYNDVVASKLKELKEIGFTDDCWELMLNRLEEDDLDLAAMSLVSKRFLSITNRLKVSLKIMDEMISLLPGILRRFQHLKNVEIDTESDEDMSGLICLISQYGLNVESLKFSCKKIPSHDSFRELGLNLKRLKALDCWRLYSLTDRDLNVIVDCFPGLEELTIGGYISDDGVKVLASKLKELKKIVFREGNHYTHRSLIFLSINCLKLREIHLINNIRLVTHEGIRFLMQHSPNLTTLALLPGTVCLRGSVSFDFESSITCARKLHSLSVEEDSSKLLSFIAKARPPLKKLKLYDNGCRGFSSLLQSCWSTLEELLQSCWSTLEELTLTNLCLTERRISEVCLPNLTLIELYWCSLLSSDTFHSLTEKCPLLEVIIMKSTSIGAQETFSLEPSHKNYRMRRLDISENKWLNDIILKNFGQVCPNLQSLSVSSCHTLTQLGIGEILMSCPKITYLDIEHLTVSNIFRRFSECFVVKLKTLKAWDTKMNDEAMAMIGNWCPDLQLLNIGHCEEVTSDGVKEVVRKCKRLRVLNVTGCPNVGIGILDWMVISRPSIALKEFISPCGFPPPGEEMRNLFLSFGCRLRKCCCNACYKNECIHRIQQLQEHREMRA
ncbi:hypothetical protein RHSIM_Rhsim01G0032800 [Rhododendron simsii]|uniref:F-box/LRR-repeat protein n=1 Tax=Rhododendron simsii TaxID=118357 RepID=A0A834HKF1_RHOSS|nr:hypothetical protein RHSIM_Rhsim01G0032800 [Rhododendron simsii]